MTDTITDADRAAFFSSYSGQVYLLHFYNPATGASESFKHALHYLGWSEDLARRMAQHRAGNGARLMEVITEAGLSFVLVKTWHGGRTLERRLKSYHGSNQLCPICRGEITLEQVLAQQAPPAPRPTGQRRTNKTSTPTFVRRAD